MKWIATVWMMAALLTGAAGSASAWSNHALGTWQALSVLPEVTAALPVRVESLESFLAAEGHRLEQVLEQQEQWARQNIPHYPARPDSIAFKAEGTPEQQRQRFIAAMRINPDLKLALFRQALPGVDREGKTVLPWSAITPLQRGTTVKKSTYLLLHEGEQATVIDVLAAASDEPDYGMDIGVWEDNGAEHGKRYGFGKQPFGNPVLEFSSQAPFHMGFYHEPAIAYKAASFLQRTYPEYRIHLYQTLAAHALQSGHSYWGWRFAGWALHYIQDLTQPYHSRVVPGVGITRLLWINTLDMMGFPIKKRQATVLVSNRHFALENYQYGRLVDAFARRDLNDLLMASIRDTSVDARYMPYTDKSPRDVISRHAYGLSDQVDAALDHELPSKYISDPNYAFGEEEGGVNLFAEMRQAQSRDERLTKLIAELMQQYGTHTRAFVRSLVKPAAAQ